MAAGSLLAFSKQKIAGLQFPYSDFFYRQLLSVMPVPACAFRIGTAFTCDNMQVIRSNLFMNRRLQIMHKAYQEITAKLGMPLRRCGLVVTVAIGLACTPQRPAS